MLSPKRLVEKTRKAILLTKDSTTLVADRGHFIAYSEDGARFMVPLAFLENPIFQELLKLSEEEFGLPGDGPITVACDAVFLEYILSLLNKRMTKDVEVALLASLSANRCSTSLSSDPRFFHHQQLLIS